jgi:hypothetical protein
MTLTPHHTKYLAYELTKRCSSDSVEKLAGALVDAQVDLNPHQVEAALFAFHSPLSKGALLADEVGLGKTIEAGLVLSQKWAERKRRILMITPANLRKQWHQEMQEKFFLPSVILEARSYDESIKRGQFRPFETTDAIVICSYQFARSKATDVHATAWDLVVIDEAHRLRNVYKPSNQIANTLKQALSERSKLLLTATPLQNSLLELFGLVSFIDEHAFGDLKSFREQFSRLDDAAVFDQLKARLKPICHRTLRRQVTSYVPYTRRHPMVQEFSPDESEDRLYTLVSDYLQRDNLQALPNSQRSLMTLVLRKLLASSSFAIAGALDTLITRLKTKLGKKEPANSLEDELDQDYESLDETAEEWTEDPTEIEPLSTSDRVALQREITDLENFRTLAVSITHNGKGQALLVALERAFAEADRLGAARKAIIFTESRRTQEYLQRVLSDSAFNQGLVLFNGSNTDPSSRKIYADWTEKNAGTDRATGSRSADIRSYLAEDAVPKVLRCYQREIARFVHTQMQSHYWEEASGYEVKVSKGFTELRPSAYTASASDSVRDFREPPADKSNMAKYLFGGFERCLYPVQKFQSDAERKLAIIADRESQKWFKPAKGQFQIFYPSAGDHLEYQPDFVAETSSVIYMLEPKARNEMSDPDVVAKRDAAIRWCERATQFSTSNGGKEWRYALIPHDAVAENMTLASLAEHFAARKASV